MRWSSLSGGDKATILGLIIPIVLWWIFTGRNKFHLRGMTRHG